MNIDFNDLVTRFGPKISRLSFRMIINGELAKEAAQEAWYEIVKSLNNFKGESDISTWIYIVAKRSIIKYARAEIALRKFEINNLTESDAVDNNVMDYEKKKWLLEKCNNCLTAICHCLNIDARLIFLLKDVSNLSHSQISEVMEISEVNTRKIVSRSREKIKNFLNDNCILYNPEGNCKCRLRKEIIAINLHKECIALSKTSGLLEFYDKFDENFPQKDYWKKILMEDVTK